MCELEEDDDLSRINEQSKKIRPQEKVKEKTTIRVHLKAIPVSALICQQSLAAIIQLQVVGLNYWFCYSTSWLNMLCTFSSVSCILSAACLFQLCLMHTATVQVSARYRLLTHCSDIYAAHFYV